MKKLILIGAIVIAMLVLSGMQGKVQANGIDGCYACYKKKNGQLRLVSSFKKCLKSEKSINLCQAETPHQELCWSTQITEYESGPVQKEPFLIRVVLTKTGDAYYLVQGYAEIPDDNPSILSGSGVVIGNKLFITINSTQEHQDSPWRDAGVAHIRVNKDTYDGTFWGNRLDFETFTREFSTGYTAGTVTYVTCP